jgi:hypothetical protein
MTILSSLEIAIELRSFGQSATVLYESLHNVTKSESVNPQIDGLKEQLYKITNVIGDLTNNNDEIDQLGDMVEKEVGFRSIFVLFNFF